MAFDGVTIANVVYQMKKELVGGRLYKIAQPEEDELLLTVRQPDGQSYKAARRQALFSFHILRLLWLRRQRPWFQSSIPFFLLSISIADLCGKSHFFSGTRAGTGHLPPLHP